jgi:hypothetical protein
MPLSQFWGWLLRYPGLITMHVKNLNDFLFNQKAEEKYDE